MPRKGPSTLEGLKQQSLLTRRQENNTRERMIKKTSAIVLNIEKCALGQLEMTQTQFNACRLWMDKTIPSLSAIQHVDVDEVSSLSREELENRIKALVEQNPMIGMISGIDKAINEVNTVKTIVPIKEKDDDTEVS